MEHLYAALLEFARDHGMWGVALFMVVENLGLPFPTEAGFVTAQALINAAPNPTLEYWVAFLFITGGHLLGAGIGYYAGRAGDNALARWFSHSRRITKAREKVQHWYARYGAMTVLFGRLVGQVRPWASYLAGAAGVPPAQYWLWTIIGTVVFVPCAMGFTAWGWQVWMKFPGIRVPALIAMFMVFYGAALYALAVKYIKHRQWQSRQAARDAVDRQEEAEQE
jgi:membrane protein DedA with SNARE-associated domain